MSRVTPAPPEEIQELVQEVRLPRGSRDVVTGEGVEADGGVDVETDGGTDADTTDRSGTEGR